LVEEFEEIEFRLRKEGENNEGTSRKKYF